MYFDFCTPRNSDLWAKGHKTHCEIFCLAQTVQLIVFTCKEAFKLLPFCATLSGVKIHSGCTNLFLFLGTNPGSFYLFVEHLGGNVLPAERHAASNLSCLLNTNAHFKALMGQYVSSNLLDKQDLTRNFEMTWNYGILALTDEKYFFVLPMSLVINVPSNVLRKYAMLKEDWSLTR